MQNYANSLEQTPVRNVWFSTLLFVLSVFVGITVGNFVGLLAALPFMDVGIMDLEAVLANPTAYPETKTGFMVMQGITSLMGFLVIPYLYLVFIEKIYVPIKSGVEVKSGLSVILALAITFFFMISNSPVIEWNMNIDFPEFMSGFERWARGMEDQLAELTKMLTKMNGPAELILALVVIAIIPGIGEEFIFRGILQNKLQRISGNAHLGIWLSAVIFGAIHMQFYGMVPRILLGAVFGYLYVFSNKRLIYPILAHAFNNGFSVIMLYMSQRGMVDYDLENQPSPSIYIIVGCVLLTGILFWQFKKIFDKEKLNGELEKGV